MLDKKRVQDMIQRHFHSTSALLLVLLSFAIIAIVLFLGNFTPLPFKKDFLWQGKMLDMLTALLVISLFAERSVEVVLVTIRTPQRQRIEYQISQLQTAQDKTKEDEKLSRSIYALDVYKLGTARFANRLSFFFGLVISLAGIRALSAMVDSETLKALQDSTLHRIFFDAVDVVVTGGVIAGGSAAIDKMGRKIRKTLDLNSTGATTGYRREPPSPAPAEAQPPADGQTPWVDLHPPESSPSPGPFPAETQPPWHPAEGHVASAERPGPNPEGRT
jgi:hypothetical protein